MNKVPKHQYQVMLDMYDKLYENALDRIIVQALKEGKHLTNSEANAVTDPVCKMAEAFALRGVHFWIDGKAHLSETMNRLNNED